MSVMKMHNRARSIVEYLSVLSMLLIVSYSPVSCGSGRSVVTQQWFRTGECASVEISKYKSSSGHQVVRSVIIEGAANVKKIMNRIERINPDGDRVRSFGEDAEPIDLLFHCSGETVHSVEIYKHQFKTPSTGFNVDSHKEESLFYDDIDNLLFPGFGKRILKIKHLPLKFENFSLVYLGETKSENGPISASWATDRFLIRTNKNGEQIIGINSGQQPPKPYNFDVGAHAYTLLTHRSGSEERLYPDYLEIVKRKQ